jgi:hypothetical protein
LAHQSFNGKEVCVVLDDSSRFILAGGEFQAATAENSIGLNGIILTRKAENYLTILTNF